MSWFARITFAAVALAALAACPGAYAAASSWAGDQRAQVRLVTATDGVTGDSLQAGVEFRYPSGWHGYWRTPGDAGIAPIFDWSASSNLTGASVSWPSPSRLVISGLQNSVYTGDFILPVKFSVKDPHKAAQLALTLDYATCSNVCVPEHAELHLTLPPGAGQASGEATAIAAALHAVPGTPDSAGIRIAHSSIDKTSKGARLRVDLRSSGIPFRAPDLFVEGAGAGLPRAPQVELLDSGKRAILEVALPSTTGVSAPLRLTVVDGQRSAEFDGPHIEAVARDRNNSRGIGVILLLALAGGLILNFMPCVLPVLSLKVFSVVKAAGAERTTARRVAFATAAGIVTSFLLLATALSILKLTGASLGWGIQFQQPWFLAGMAVVTTLFAASFFDWLPIGLPQALARFGGGAPSRGPLIEAFVAGMLSTLLATPCSAPFVGTAVGFALARNPADIFAVLLALGAGMALPFITLALLPSLAARLPRPGQWMIHLRKAMGLLLLATSVWLLASLWNVAGATVAVVVAGLLLAVLAIRAIVSIRRRVGTARWPGLVTALLCAVAVGLAGIPLTNGQTRQGGDAGWQAFDPKAIDTAVAGGKTVLVDVTASWCLTCKVNELTVLNTAAVRERLGRGDVVLMRADWSRYDPKIAQYVQGFGRFGIPLDVVYGPGKPQGQLLPEVLQPSTLFAALHSAQTSTPPDAAHPAQAGS
ncbi:protein-disulfide reductase DsbD family protein [Paraburkholderia rhizosphaerae]|uniref:Suppressor for copper-sensitivity B n=1 Tax=Paraburkholderia rhizosphaerae TaxID=480658 RepID=A0A4R8LC62_9BURK|nr:protein-disulfide reductase DsbD domain-containing protein [Paraburkholderia rhizosphaerae]TDY40533.1 suppressor for copper-sensitivity B [Paraburkholderia rhizosphaerae]